MILKSAALATLLAATTGLTPVPAGQPAAAPATAVTLITGDKVSVAGDAYRIQPAPGRTVSFSRQVRDGHVYVIPSDARPLIAQGVLDERLFDITRLLSWKYGDADRPDIPVIVQGAAPQGAQRATTLAGLGMTTLRVPKANAPQTWQDLTGGTHALARGTGKLWLDGRRSFALDQSVRQIGATEAWRQGFTGKGVTVAVLDSGYDPDHPALKSVVTQARNFSEDPDIRDRLGHGTHVASIVAGAGETYRGVAPDAKIAFGKVGSVAGPTESAILAGMEWAATEVKAKVVNLSIGGPDTTELDPLEQAVNTLSEQAGTLFVVAAGNGGELSQVGSPGSAEAALTVGAVDKQDRMADFSSPGPRVGDHAIKPDLTAPGVDITAAWPGGGHRALSGTSMATPHVAGAAAILAQRHPDWTGRQLKAALIGSAKPIAGATLYQQGAGRVDLVRALAQQVAATPANVWAAFPWNDPAERVAKKTLTYTNAGDTPISLDLTTEGEVLSLSAQRLEVPARGEASVTLTIDAAKKAPGDYPGTVTARSGPTVIRTPAGAYVEPESYDVTVTALDRSGAATDSVLAQLYDAKTGKIQELVFQNGTAKVRVPEGDWALHSETNEGRAGVTVANTALTVKDGDQKLTLDARQGKQVKMGVDDPTATPERGHSFAMGDGKWGISWWSSRDANTGVAVVPAHRRGLHYLIRTVWHGEQGTVYDLVDRHTDGIPADPTYLAKRAELSKLTVDYRAFGTAAKGLAMTAPRMREAGDMFPLSMGEVDLPGTLTHYRTPGLVWESAMEVGSSLVADGGRPMRHGHLRETWNTAVTGPSFALPGGSRTSDTLVYPAHNLFSDGAAGRSGMDGAATGTATLASNGTVLATAELSGCEAGNPGTCVLSAELPAGAATYQLTTSMRRQVPHSVLSTAVESVWTFRSARTAGQQALPLMAVRLAPDGLDTSNRAKAGSRLVLPLRVERNPGSPQATVTSMRLEMSADDGTTWQRVPVLPAPSGWTALVTNPATPGFVTLRATAKDTTGATVTQTITRAYATN